VLCWAFFSNFIGASGISALAYALYTLLKILQQTLCLVICYPETTNKNRLKMSISMKTKWLRPLISLLAIPVILGVNLPVAAQAKKDWVIVIDPGHGGTDPGAVGGGIKEKDITLAIALKLGKQLAALEHTKVFYTRDSDVTVELYKRPQKANELKADLFISIHCNSVESTKPYGAETWVMGLHKSKSNLEVAKAENAVILLEPDYKTKYDGFDPNSPEGEIIFSLYQNAFLDQSVEVASLVQKELKTNAQRFDRGVKQAGFLVLWKINMPGILVEAGFLSNENERTYLKSDAGQTTIATSIYNAVTHYRQKVDGTKAKPIAISGIDTQPKPTEENPKVSPNPSPDTPEKPIKPEDQKPAQTTPAKQTPVVSDPKPQTIQTSPPELYFSVQFLSTSKKREPNDPAFSGLKEVHVYAPDGTYRYVSGYFKTVEQAIHHKNEMQKAAFPDAFVVAFHHGKRISLTEANQLLKK
jgi:N-acetylmuramoyl-L-alanine amidase